MKNKQYKLLFTIFLVIGTIVFLYRDINEDIILLKNHAKQYARDNRCFGADTKSPKLICKDHIASFNEDNNILWVKYNDDIEKIYIEKDSRNRVVLQPKNGDKIQFEYYGSLDDFIFELKKNHFPFVEAKI